MSLTATISQPTNEAIRSVPKRGSVGSFDDLSTQNTADPTLPRFGADFIAIQVDFCKSLLSKKRESWCYQSH
jgi:hypothetical protein